MTGNLSLHLMEKSACKDGEKIFLCVMPFFTKKLRQITANFLGVNVGL